MNFRDRPKYNVEFIKQERIKHPYNNRIRTVNDGCSHPCITCGTYIDSGLLYCPNDRRCVRLAIKLDICLGSPDPDYHNSSIYGGGVHNYQKFDYGRCILFKCKKCTKEIKSWKKIKRVKEKSVEGENIIEQTTTFVFEKTQKYKRVAYGWLRHAVLKRDNYRCVECGATKDDHPLEIDHKLPYSRGGTTELDNLQILCKPCNRAKRTRIWFEEL